MEPEAGGDAVDCDDPALPSAGTDDFLAAMADLRTLYPEYLTDPNILICPSDAGADEDEFVNPDSGITDVGLPCDRSSRGINDADESYMYFGWVFDQLEYGDPPVDMVTVGALVGAAGLEGTGPAQLAWTIVDAILSAMAGGHGNDEDVDLSTYGANLGNGGGDTVYRLREGIERFMITDINNPAASAQAQSETWIMADVLATVSEDYNHVPGGSNVLYMDGHVAFLRYSEQAEAPVNGPVARFAGALLQ